jgi:hypothetical protein
MKSGLRGGKPRDMATFKKGGVSRGAGASKKGFDYAIYKKGGKVKKYQEGGALPERDPQTGTRQYASFSDWMGDLFGKKKVPASAMDETTTRAIRETERARPAAAPEEDRETRRPAPGAARAMLPTAQRARMQRRRPAPASRGGIGGAGIDPERYATPEAEMRSMLPPRPLDLTRPEYRPESAYEPYRKGGVVKKAGGGSCRGMGAAQRGGKYTIK